MPIYCVQHKAMVLEIISISSVGGLLSDDYGLWFGDLETTHSDLILILNKLRHKIKCLVLHLT